MGETPNLAARLQGMANPNRVVIAESPRRLVGNVFELENLAARDLKGISAPVRAWGAIRPLSVESRFDAHHASGLTELVGWEEELEILQRRWSKAKASEGQVVLLSGEPGTPGLFVLSIVRPSSFLVTMATACSIRWVTCSGICRSACSLSTLRSCASSAPARHRQYRR